MDQVLVADANPLCREGLSAILRQLYEPEAVLTVSDLAGAVHYLSQPTPVTLLVVDLALPGLEELEGMQRLRMKYSGLRVVAVAWGEDRNSALAALGAGAHGYVPKTLSAPDMLTAFRTVMGGQVYVPPMVADMARQVSRNPPPACGLAPGVSLTARQRDVIQLLSAGRSNKQIARALSIAEGTVKVHMTAAFRTLGVHNRVSAAAAMRNRDIWREDEPFLPGLSRSPEIERRQTI
ncbi:MAG: LuxR C-terminal-related transcriptional regulator [Brevundimonas sp.]